MPDRRTSKLESISTLVVIGGGLIGSIGFFVMLETPHGYDKLSQVDHTPAKIRYWNGEERIYGAGAINKYSWAGATYVRLHKMVR